MASNTRPIQFRNYLPEVFRSDEVDGVSFLSQFLRAFETRFEELEAAIEGTPGGILRLTVESASGTTITVTPFNSGPVEFPIDALVTVRSKSLRTALGQFIPANRVRLTQIEVKDASFVNALEAGDTLDLHPGGIPDLFNPDTTPPPQFIHRSLSEFEKFEFLNYLASWIGLPLRPEKSVDWNREFFKTAIAFYSRRGTLPGLEALLRAWLKDDLLETEPPLLIMTDLTRSHTDVDTVWQIGETATLGVDTQLGEGPPFFFIVDVIANSTELDFRNPVGLDTFQRTVRFLLDAEKPAHTYYQLRVRSHTMQLPEPEQTTIDGRPGARIGETTLLWGEPWVFDSDC